MNNLVFVSESQQLVTSSFEIAEGTQNQHKNVLSMVRKYLNDLKEFGEVAFETQLNTQGSPTEYALLNEHQATFLLTLMRNNEIVLEFKKKLVKAFFKMAEELKNVENGNTEVAPSALLSLVITNFIKNNINFIFYCLFPFLQLFNFFKQLLFITKYNISIFYIIFKKKTLFKACDNLGI